MSSTCSITRNSFQHSNPPYQPPIFDVRGYAIDKRWLFCFRAAAIDPNFKIDLEHNYWEVPAGVNTENLRKLFHKFKAWNNIALNITIEGVRRSEKDISAIFRRVRKSGGKLVAYLVLDEVTGKWVPGMWKPTEMPVLLSKPVRIFLEGQASFGGALVE